MLNPEFLELDELDYEMSIRNLHLDSKRKKTFTLSKFLSDENNGLRPLPSSPNLDPDEEVTNCGVKLDLLKLGLEVVFRHKDFNELSRCQSRFLHVKNRAQRIVPVSLFSVNSHKDLLIQIGELEAKINWFSDEHSSTTQQSTRMPIVSNIPGNENQFNSTSSQGVIPVSTSLFNDLVSDLNPTYNPSNPISSKNHSNISLNPFETPLVIPTSVPSFASPTIPVKSPTNNPQSNVDTEAHKKIGRLEDMIERLSISVNQIVEANNRSQLGHLNQDRHLGAIPKTSYYPPTLPTWTLPTTIPTVRHSNQFNPPTSQVRFINNPITITDNHEFIDPPQNQFRSRQQTPHYERFSSEPAGRDPNAGHHYNINHTPLLTSSFIADNPNQNYPHQHQNFGNSFQGGRKAIPVHKWRISFDGENDLNDFLSKVEMYTKFESTPDNELISSIGYLFSKRALSWYRVHYKNFRSWYELKSALIEEFLPSHSDFQIFNQINSRFQAKNESFGEYLSAMQILFSYMSDPPNASHQLQLIRRNMDTTYMFALSTQEITTVKQLAQICRRLDDTKDMIQMRSKTVNSSINSHSSIPNKRVQFSEVSEFPNDCDEEVASLTVPKKNENRAANEQFSRRTPPVIACWNCLKVGHTFNYCPQEKLRLFCYTCGMHNTSRPKCPKCCPGNQRPGSQSPN